MCYCPVSVCPVLYRNDWAYRRAIDATRYPRGCSFLAPKSRWNSSGAVASPHSVFDKLFPIFRRYTLRLATAGRPGWVADLCGWLHTKCAVYSHVTRNNPVSVAGVWMTTTETTRFPNLLSDAKIKIRLNTILPITQQIDWLSTSR